MVEDNWGEESVVSVGRIPAVFVHYKETTAWIRKHKTIKIGPQNIDKTGTYSAKKDGRSTLPGIRRLQHRPLVKSAYTSA